MTDDKLNRNMLPHLAILLKERCVSKAAQKIKVTQPAVSHVLSELRTLFQDQLMIKNDDELDYHVYKKTPKGEVLDKKLSPQLLKLETLLNSHNKLMEENSKTHFVMGADDHINALLIPELAKNLSMGSPQTTVEMKFISEEALDDVALGRVDLMCSESKIKLKKPCMKALLYKDQYICVARKETPLADKAMTGHNMSETHIIVAPMKDNHISKIKNSLQEESRNPTPLSIVSYHDLEEGAMPNTEDVLIVSELFFKRSPFLESYIRIKCPWQLPVFRYHLFWHQKYEENPYFVYLKKSLLDILNKEKQKEK